MAMKLYGPPLPYGGWALSLGLLLRAFFWLKFEESEEVDGSSSGAATGWGGDNDGEEFEEGQDDSEWAENREEGHETWRGTSSSAYQTDEEARRERMAARRHSERLRREGFVPASGLVTPTTTAMDGASFDTPSRRAPKAAAAAAITAAAAALRRPHLDRLEPVDKSRVRRELLRARLHTHVQRELARHVTLAAAVFDESSPR